MIRNDYIIKGRIRKKSEAFGMICNVTETIITRDNSQYYIKHCACYARKLPLALKNTYPSVLSSVSSMPHLTSKPRSPPPPRSGGCRWLEGCVTVGSCTVRLLPLTAGLVRLGDVLFSHNHRHSLSYPQGAGNYFPRGIWRVEVAHIRSKWVLRW